MGGGWGGGVRAGRFKKRKSRTGPNFPKKKIKDVVLYALYYILQPPPPIKIKLVALLPLTFISRLHTDLYSRWAASKQTRQT